MRPVTRTGHDGFVVRETVAECLQTLELRANELARLKINKPIEMPDDTVLRLYGSNALVFDEFGQLKYDIGTALDSSCQTGRLQTLWERGFYVAPDREAGSFAALHRKAMQQRIPSHELW